MSIDIYDKADIIKKEDVYYFFVKSGSKNCTNCPFQTIVDDNWNYKFVKRETRESDWKLIATGGKDEIITDAIANTEWNAPTSWYYGQVRFGNKKNIALYFAKSKNKIKDYYSLTESQQKNIDNKINYYMNEQQGKYTIDLKNIKENEKMKTEIIYCGNNFSMHNDYITFNGKNYWNLDNL